MRAASPNDEVSSDDRRSFRAARASSWYLLAVVPLTIVYFVVPTETAKLVVWPIIGWSSVFAILVGVALNRPDSRAAWYLLAGGVMTLLVGDHLSSYQYLVRQSEEVFPSYTDVVYLAMYPLIVAGLAVLVRRRSLGRDRSIVVDAAMITGGLGLVWWVLFLAPYYRDGELQGLERLVSIAFPFGDILVVATAVRLAVAGGRRPRAFWLLAGGLLSLLVADAFYGYVTLDGSFAEHTPVDFGWIVFYMAWGAAALHPSMRTVAEVGPSSRSTGSVRLAVVGSAVLIPPAMLFAQDAVGNVTDATPIAITGGLLFVLVLVRIVGIVRTAAEARSETRIRALVDKSSDAIMVIDGQTRIRYHSSAAEHIFARSEAELEGATLTDLLGQSDAEHLRVILASQSPTTNVEWRIRRADGQWRDLEVIADDLRGNAEVDGLVLTVRDITRRKQFDMELRHQALHDSLTGLPNRVLFMDRVEQAMKRADRRGGAVTVLFLDLDDFKMINDSLGHGIGDTLLVAVAARLHASIRVGDTLARLGGDEFGFLLEGGDAEEGVATATRIEEVLREPFVIGERLIQLWASIGIAMGSLRIKMPDDVLRDAELAMYIAKRKGKNRFELFRPEMQDDAARRRDVAAELLGGMDRGELCVHYQPIVEVSSGTIVGAEALVRWQHPRRGLLLPDEFIPVAEATGLIGSLDRWVLNEACTQAAAWKAAKRCDDPLYVSVNISSRHLQDKNLAGAVRDALVASGLTADSLVLEVTETALIDDVDSATEILAQLKDIGVKIAVDDFGTGYSSLTHLIKFPLDIIKIDKSFVARVSNGSGGDVMVRAVVDLAHTLGLTTVAEGVEEAAQAQALDDLSCRCAQGYFYSRPVPAEDMSLLLVERHLSVVGQRPDARTSRS